MEDAMIISKSSCERGFGKAVVISFKVLNILFQWWKSYISLR